MFTCVPYFYHDICWNHGYWNMIYLGFLWKPFGSLRRKRIFRGSPRIWYRNMTSHPQFYLFLLFMISYTVLITVFHVYDIRLVIQAVPSKYLAKIIMYTWWYTRYVFWHEIYTQVLHIGISWDTLVNILNSQMTVSVKVVKG